MERTFDFGKYDYRGCGRKINDMTVTLEIRTTDKGPELSIRGDVWNGRHTDLVAGGQCLDEMYDFLKGRKVFKELYRLWKNYHLNGMHAGTVEQEKLVDESRKNGIHESVMAEMNKDIKYDFEKKSDYDVDCEILRRNNLFTVKLVDGKDYRYGMGWLYRPIPNEEWDKINALLNTSNSMEMLKDIL